MMEKTYEEQIEDLAEKLRDAFWDAEKQKRLPWKKSKSKESWRAVAKVAYFYHLPND